MWGNGRIIKNTVKGHSLYLMEERGVGEFRNNRPWNMTEYKDGKIFGK